MASRGGRLDRIGDAEQSGRLCRRRPRTRRSVPPAAAPRRVRVELPGSMPCVVEMLRGCRPTRVCPSTMPLTPLPVVDSKSVDARERDVPLARAATIAPASGCSLTLSRLAARRSRSSAVDARRRFDRHEARLAFGERSGLVDDERRHAFEDLERLGVANQDAELGAAAGADHDRHRRREPERARAGDDQHRDGVDQRVREARLGAEDAPRRRT